MKLLVLVLFASVVFHPTSTPGVEPSGLVESVRFRTSAEPPIYRVPQNLQPYEGVFRFGLGTLPEGLLVTGALQLGGQSLGLSSGQGTNLSTLLTNAYAHIYADPAFAGTPSALPYCFSPQPHTNGHYFLYHPKTLPPEPKVIVFLHGYGGNFQFYTWAIKEALPEAVIMAPSWGVS